MSSQATRDELIQDLVLETGRMAGIAVLFSQAVAERVGLNPTDLEALEILLREGPVPAGRLAERTGLTTGAITGVVDRLERRGFVRRRPDPGDRRRVIVEAEMESVERELGPFYGGMQTAMTTVGAGLSDADLALVLRVIREANALAAEQIDRLRSSSDTGEPGR